MITYLLILLGNFQLLYNCIIFLRIQKNNILVNSWISGIIKMLLEFVCLTLLEHMKALPVNSLRRKLVRATFVFSFHSRQCFAFRPFQYWPLRSLRWLEVKNPVSCLMTNLLLCSFSVERIWVEYWTGVGGDLLESSYLKQFVIIM
jgi:hypothetical protein